MGAVRALQKRVARLERAGKPRPSPFVVAFGSFDSFVEVVVFPGIETGALDRTDMIEVIAALRMWEEEDVWALA
jgi:hypothetical protein